MSANRSRRVRVPLLRGATISTHLIVLLAVQAILLASLIAYSAAHDFTTSRERADTAATADANIAARLLAKAVSDNANELSVQAGASGYEAVFADPQACTLSGHNEDFLGSDISIVRPDGTIACTSLRTAGGLPGPGYGTSAWFASDGGATKPITAGPLVDPVSHQYAFLVAIPFRQGGMLVASYRLVPTGHALVERIGFPRPAPSFIVTTADRRALVTASVATSVRSLTGTAFARPLDRQGQILPGAKGDAIYAEAVVPELGWHVLAGISTKDAFADARRSLRDRGFLGLIMILVVFGAGLVIQQRFVRPVRSLRDATIRVAEGDLDLKLEPWGPKEIADLANGFNFMAGMRAKAEDSLREAYLTEVSASERLRELDDIKNAFLMAISHELRTPLTAVMGYATLLKQELPDAPRDVAMDYAGRIEISAKRLQRLMLDLLDFERMSRGVVEPHRQQTNMRQLVDRVLLQLESERSIKVDVPVDLVADVDAPLLERVVENLVINAQKHTPVKSAIWVRGFKVKNKVVLAVEDSGTGVPKELRKTIFEPFKQGKVPSHSPGTGVGLALVSQFAKLHGGRAWVEDRPGGGASFRVTLPAAPSRSKRANKSERYDLSLA